MCTHLRFNANLSYPSKRRKLQFGHRTGFAHPSSSQRDRSCVHPTHHLKRSIQGSSPRNHQGLNDVPLHYGKLNPWLHENHCSTLSKLQPRWPKAFVLHHQEVAYFNHPSNTRSAQGTRIVGDEKNWLQC